MTDYVGDVLLEKNPCGIERKPETHCRYVPECKALGSKGGFVCTSLTSYNVAKFMWQDKTNYETELEETKKFLESCIGKTFVDPKEEQWNPRILADDDIGKLADEITKAGEHLLNDAKYIGSQRNPVTFDCDTKDVIRDL